MTDTTIYRVTRERCHLMLRGKREHARINPSTIVVYCGTDQLAARIHYHALKPTDVIPTCDGAMCRTRLVAIRPRIKP